MVVVTALRVNEHDDFTVQQAERNPARLAVVLANVFACDGKVVPDHLGADEVESVEP